MATVGKLEPDDITLIVTQTVEAVNKTLPVILPRFIDEYLGKSLPGVVRMIVWKEAEGAVSDAIEEALQEELTTYTFHVTSRKR